MVSLDLLVIHIYWCFGVQMQTGLWEKRKYTHGLYKFTDPRAVGLLRLQGHYLQLNAKPADAQEVALGNHSFS